MLKEKHYAQMYAALSRIKAYQSPDQLKKDSWEEWGVPDGNEAVEMAYENVIHEANYKNTHMRESDDDLRSLFVRHLPHDAGRNRPITF